LVDEATVTSPEACGRPCRRRCGSAG
jgi:hypothetical protein